MDLGLILTCLICFLVIDYVVIGSVPMLVGAWPRTRNFISKDEVLFQSPIHGLRTNINKDMYFYHIGYRTSFFSHLIVSDSWLLVKNTLLTCLPPINTKNITGYRIKRGLLGKRTVLFIENGKKKYLSFRTKDKDQLASILYKLGINEQAS